MTVWYFLLTIVGANAAAATVVGPFHDLADCEKIAQHVPESWFFRQVKASDCWEVPAR